MGTCPLFSTLVRPALSTSGSAFFIGAPRAFGALADVHARALRGENIPETGARNLRTVRFLLRIFQAWIIQVKHFF